MVSAEKVGGNPVRIEFSPTQTIPPGVKPGYFDEGFDLNRRLEELGRRLRLQPSGLRRQPGRPRLNMSRARRQPDTEELEESMSLKSACVLRSSPLDC